LQTIIDDLKAEFDQVPLDEVDQHVNQFLDGLVQSGFIGTIENLPG
jgi:hypothetical protein